MKLFQKVQTKASINPNPEFNFNRNHIKYGDIIITEGKDSRWNQGAFEQLVLNAKHNDEQSKLLFRVIFEKYHMCMPEEGAEKPARELVDYFHQVHSLQIDAWDYKGAMNLIEGLLTIIDKLKIENTTQKNISQTLSSSNPDEDDSQNNDIE